MNPFRALVPVLLLAAWSSASAETVKFEDSAGILGASCAKDIQDNCRGVNLDAGRLKDCLARNEDVMSAQCKVDYARAFDAIQKRVAARQAVAKLCQRDVTKYCGSVPKDDRGQVLDCLLAGPRGMTLNCNKALGEAGYR
jgi:hypothetical protein